MYLLYLAAKSIAALLVILFLYVVKRHRDNVQRLRFYEKQGISCVPGYDSFPFGNTL